MAQICSTSSLADNLTWCVRLMRKAADTGAKMLFLPEATDYISESKEQGLAMAQPLEGEFVTALKKQAKESSLWLSVGVHERIEGESRIFNTHLVIDSTGQLVQRYRKLHLFDVNIENGPVLMESEGVRRGEAFVEPVSTPVGKVGLSTCYDIRFPELSLMQRHHGAQILTYPSAFTVKTGQAHWGLCSAIGGGFPLYVLIANIYSSSFARRGAVEGQSH